MSRLHRSILFTLVVMSMSCISYADDAVSFTRDIRPILSDHCFACHGPDEQQRQADLRIDNAQSAMESGAISPGNLTDSAMWLRVNSVDPEEVMPPPEVDKKLTDRQRELIGLWIESGADYQQHWSFVTPTRPELPPIGVAHPIDAFVQHRLAAEGLAPAPLADPRTLIRRVTLELTGLPPTPQEVDAFLADESENAYERLIDRLMSRLTYGEHMARYWLDLARYADTHGLHLDNERSMWPYRDWVVRAFQQNLPFDQFTRWQLAGDLLENPTRDQLIASGFNRCNISTGEGGSINEEWIFRYAVDRTSTAAEVWLGLTAGCAVCHDHKFDPLSTREFYSMYAFFHSAADPAMDGNKIDTPPILKIYSQADEGRIRELDSQLATLNEAIRAKLEALRYVDPAALNPPPPIRKIDGVTMNTATDPAWSFAIWKEQNAGKRNDKLPEGLRQLVRGKQPKDWSNVEAERVFDFWLGNFYSGAVELLAELKSQKSEIETEKAEIEKNVPITFVMADLAKPRESYVMQRGAYDKPGERVTRGVPAFLPELPALPEDGDYNRLDFANWLVSGEHPLTARVTVNRLWQQLFGTGIVRTSADFGSQGDPPSHPELLDWLAVQFVEEGWDAQKIVKLILTSHTYRQSSEVEPSTLERDPGNRLLARAPRLRLDAEVLRDQALFVSGLLVDQVGGRPVKPYQPPDIWEPVGFGSSNTRYYKQDTGNALYRRSLYTFLKRTAPPPFMSTFDAPNREQSCSRRARSNTPMQALQLMNDVQHVEAARGFAARIVKYGGEDPLARIRWAWRVAVSREPNESELQICSETLAAHRARYDSDLEAAKRLITYGQSEPDESIEVSELASYTMLANLLLNLDESVTKN